MRRARPSCARSRRSSAAPRFDAWLKGWFDRHAFQPVTSAMLLADMRQNLVKGDKALEDRLMLDRWVYQPGIPPNMVRPPASTFAEQDKAARRVRERRSRRRRRGRAGSPTSGCASSTACRASSRKRGSTRSSRAFALNDTHQHGGALRLARSGGRQPLRPGRALARAFPDVARPRQVRQAALFKALAKDQQWGRPIAKRIYAEARPLYHPLVTRDLDKLGLRKRSLTPLKRSFTLRRLPAVERRADVRGS